ncbi:MAG: dihydrofolate reductase family protein [Elusimicrobiota bacterium]|nr:dihydrofolate reductase family protein [Elusimicrobiota bacterium]
MKVSVFIATSLDGFIAREDGRIDWLPSGEPAPDAEDYGYKDFISTVDTLVMGRKTYETALSFGEWPYENKSVIVLSSKALEIPGRIAKSVEHMSLAPKEVVQALAKRGATHLYIDGGATIQGFLKAQLIHQMTITQIPVLLGSGIPLFGKLENDIRLRHMNTRHFPSGFVQSKYEIAA